MENKVARKMTRKEFTQAVQAYARKHGHFASFVRTNTTARRAAIEAHAQKIGIICTGLQCPAY